MTYNDREATVAEGIFKTHLEAQVEKYIKEFLANDIKKIAKDTVKHYIEFNIAKEHVAMNMNDRFMFSFVQKVIQTRIEPVVVENIND